MPLNFDRANYNNLNCRQKENFNYSKISAVLADFGYTSIRLSDDWNGADFIAMHVDGKTILRVQLKGRLLFRSAYENRNLYIDFPNKFNNEVNWYLYDHDELLNIFDREVQIRQTQAWIISQSYDYPGLGYPFTSPPLTA